MWKRNLLALGKLINVLREKCSQTQKKDRQLMERRRTRTRQNDQLQVTPKTPSLENKKQQNVSACPRGTGGNVWDFRYLQAKLAVTNPAGF